ncbi:MAG: class I SAM-dependent methyltransferase [Bradyrhizobium sp.]
MAQDYPDRELIILDDGEDGVADLVPDDARIRYVREARRRLVGAKRNTLCELAQGGIIVHWDDDDWSAPQRLRLQVETLTRAGADACGLARVLFLSEDGRAAWEYSYPNGGTPWVYGASLCYTKDFWRRNRFPDIGMGEDTRFVWADPRARIEAMPDNRFLVALVHAANTSPKRVRDPVWRPCSPDAIRALMGRDFAAYAADAPATPALASQAPRAVAPPLRNVYACLVHENSECVLDLVRNLRHLDGHSRILLYDGSPDGNLLDMRLPWSRWGVEICRERRPMKWGKLHGFALDCLRYLKSSEAFDVMTVVDSDQLALRAGYPEFLGQRLSERTGLGLLSSAPEPQGPNTRIAPSRTAHAERDLWRPFLRRFPNGEEKFVHWTFWPATVLTADAGSALLDLFDNDGELDRILAASRLWATEEVLFPTLTALLGFRVERNPCSYDYVKYRAPYSAGAVEAALQQPDAYWMHPVPRTYAHPVRARIRQFHGDYCSRQGGHGSVGQPHVSQLWPILRTMRSIEGWLEDEEAELLAIAAREALTRSAGPKTIVEVGSYCGKATFVLASVVKMCSVEARVVAIDAFDGVVGALDRGLVRRGPTLKKFTRMLEQTALTHWVEPHVGRAPSLAWNQTVDLLLVDGLHDYANVAQDFSAFEAWLPAGALAAFHDYADYFPGVCAFVDELLAGGDWHEVAHAGSMKVLRRSGDSKTPAFVQCQFADGLTHGVPKSIAT